MKRLLLLFALLPALAFGGFPVQTNTFTRQVIGDASPDYEDFAFNWSGYDDQEILALFGNVTFSYCGFRMAYPLRGKVYVDLNTTNNVSVYPTNYVVIENEVFTNWYSRIVYTNFYPKWSNVLVTLAAIGDYYTNIVSSAAATSIITTAGATNQVFTNSQATYVVYTGTNRTTDVDEYGRYTNVYMGATSTVTYVTNINITTVYGSNFIKNGSFETLLTHWAATTNVVFSSGMARLGAPNQTGTLSQALSGISTGNQITLSFFYSAASSEGSVAYELGGVTTVANHAHGTHEQTLTAINLNALTFTIKTGPESYEYGVIDDVVCRPYKAAETISTTGTATTAMIGSNVQAVAYPPYTRTNTLFNITSNDYIAVKISLPRTNLPPDGSYFTEFLAYDGNISNVPTRTLAKGMIPVVHSIYANTNQASWTNPTAGQVIGPPGHTLTDEGGWPFVRKVGSVMTGPLTGTVFYGSGAGLTDIVTTVEGSTSFVRKVGGVFTGPFTNQSGMYGNGVGITNVTATVTPESMNGATSFTRISEASTQVWASAQLANATQYLAKAGGIAYGAVTSTAGIGVGNIGATYGEIRFAAPDNGIEYYIGANADFSGLVINPTGGTGLEVAGRLFLTGQYPTNDQEVGCRAYNDTRYGGWTNQLGTNNWQSSRIASNLARIVAAENNITTNSTLGATAYSWGNHALAGYLSATSNRFDSVTVAKRDNVSTNVCALTASAYTGSVTTVAYTGGLSYAVQGLTYMIGFQKQNAYGTATLSVGTFNVTATSAGGVSNWVTILDDVTTQAILRIDGDGSSKSDVSNIYVRLVTNGNAYIANAVMAYRVDAASYNAQGIYASQTGLVKAAGDTVRAATLIRGTNWVDYTDLTNAFKAITDNCELQIHPGSYRVTGARCYEDQTTVIATNAFAAIQAKSNVVVRGVGKPTIYLENWADCLALENVDGVRIEGIRFTGAGIGETNLSNFAMIQLMRTNKHVTVEGCEFVDFGSHGVASLNDPRWSSYVTVRNCRFENGGTKFHPTLGADGAAICGGGEHWNIVGNTIRRCLRGIEMETHWDYGPIRYVNIEGNDVEYANLGILSICAQNGTNVGDVTIRGNLVRQIYDYPAIMATGSELQAAVTIWSGQRYRIIDNQFQRYGNPGGIRMRPNGTYRIEDVLIANNSFSTSTYTAIDFDRANGGVISNVLVSGNSIANSGAQGMYVDGENITIAGNNIRDCYGPASGWGISVVNVGSNTRNVAVMNNVISKCYEGIDIAAAVTGTVVWGNQFWGNGLGNVFDNGVSSKVNYVAGDLDVGNQIRLNGTNLTTGKMSEWDAKGTGTVGALIVDSVSQTGQVDSISNTGAVRGAITFAGSSVTQTGTTFNFSGGSGGDGYLGVATSFTRNAIGDLTNAADGDALMFNGAVWTNEAPPSGPNLVALSNSIVTIGGQTTNANIVASNAATSCTMIGLVASNAATGVINVGLVATNAQTGVKNVGVPATNAYQWMGASFQVYVTNGGGFDVTWDLATPDQPARTMASLYARTDNSTCTYEVIIIASGAVDWATTFTTGNVAAVATTSGVADITFTDGTLAQGESVGIKVLNYGAACKNLSVKIR